MGIPGRVGTDLAMPKKDSGAPVVVPLRKGATRLEAEELRRHHERVVLPGLRESDPGPNSSACVLPEMWHESVPTDRRAHDIPTT
jgi:hypothetical protein